MQLFAGTVKKTVPVGAVWKVEKQQIMDFVKKNMWIF